MARAQDGDPAAFEALVRHHQTRLFRFVVRMTRDRGDAEDVIQDTWVSVWRRLPTLTDRDAFQPWLYQIGHRQALAVLRARSRRDTPTPDTALEPPTSEAGPQQRSEDHARQRSLDTLVAELPVDLRACWVLTEVNGLTYPETAQALGVPVSTVRGRIARARHQLAEGMDPWRP